ncbi:mitochondrial carrier domain-containing protein [Fusarium solani]|uniref:Mitochondrial carrier domain-containing protein n=1 Tax=Fusarium solani TaxID=169388 RepID=A0A9P9HDD2_FUSSL|nr:mitochondrial carrier domain-containing protein [Fusarium solani]KAH7254424.1 mitochondrial carrier domain-containing protein [Fusarium solani]
MVRVTVNIINTEGYRGLYAGLSVALLRQLTYSTVWFGVYEDLNVRLHIYGDADTPSHLLLIPLSALSGFMGGVAGNPADIVNVRMQADGMLQIFKVEDLGVTATTVCSPVDVIKLV